MSVEPPLMRDVLNGVLNSRVDASGLYSSFPATQLTPAELAAGVTPVNYAFDPYTDSRRQDAKCDGATDDRSKLQAQIDSSASGTTIQAARRVELTATDNASNFKCSAGLTINPLRTIYEGNGNTLDFSGITSGAFVGLTLDVAGISTNISNVAATMGTRGLRNLVISMPGYTVNSLGVGLRLTDSVGDGGGNYFGPRHRIDAVTIYGGNVGVHFSQGSFCECVTGLTVMHGAVNTLNIAIYADSTWPTTDGGEAPNFYGTFIASAQTAIWLTGGNMRFHGGNIDGCLTIAKQDNIGTIYLGGMYFEFVDGNDTQFKFDASNNNSKIDIIGCEFGVRENVGVRATTAFGNAVGTVNFINNRLFESAGIVQWYTANSGFLFTGSGTVNASGNTYRNFPWFPLVSKKNQWLAYPDINNANALASFTLSKVGFGVNPVRAAGISDGTTTRDAIDFKISAGGVANDESAAVFTHSVIPGRNISIVGGYYCPLINGSNLVLEIVAMSFKDSAGNIISGPFTQSLATTLSTVNSWTTIPGFSAGVPAGAETMTVEIRLRATGAIAADRHCYLSPLGIGYAEGS